MEKMWADLSLKSRLVSVKLLKIELEYFLRFPFSALNFVLFPNMPDLHYTNTIF